MTGTKTGKALVLLALIGAMFATTPVSACTQGLTPGFWKNHTDKWVGYNPIQLVSVVFSSSPSDLNGDGNPDTLLDALRYKGGGGYEGAARILLRAAVAALLNAAHPDIDYTTPAWVINNVNSALASGDRSTMLDLASELDGYNNLGGVELDP